MRRGGVVGLKCIPPLFAEHPVRRRLISVDYGRPRNWNSQMTVVNLHNNIIIIINNEDYDGNIKNNSILFLNTN